MPISWNIARSSPADDFLTDKTVLIENRKHQGRTGFHVITPLQLADSDLLVLVNRGWIAGQRTDPQINIPQPQGALTIEGEVSIPQPPALELSLQLRKPRLCRAGPS